MYYGNAGSMAGQAGRLTLAHHPDGRPFDLLAWNLTSASIRFFRKTERKKIQEKKKKNHYLLTPCNPQNQVILKRGEMFFHGCG